MQGRPQLILVGDRGREDRRDRWMRKARHTLAGIAHSRGRGRSYRGEDSPLLPPHRGRTQGDWAVVLWREGGSTLGEALNEEADEDRGEVEGQKWG